MVRFMSEEGWTVEAALAKLREALSEKGMSVDDMFAAFDADSDGTINGPELHFGIKDMLGDVLSPAHISDIIVALDANEDNRIDLGELRSSLSEEEGRFEGRYGIVVSMGLQFECQVQERYSCRQRGGHGVRQVGWPAI